MCVQVHSSILQNNWSLHFQSICQYCFEKTQWPMLSMFLFVIIIVIIIIIIIIIISRFK